MVELRQEGRGRRIRARSLLFCFVVVFAGLTLSVSRADAESGSLLAYEPFGKTGATPRALHGAGGGGDQGWAAGWVEQMGSTAVPGYEVTSAAPLTYSGLVTTSSYATGGYGYQNAGRALNVSANGPFASYLSGGLIGAAGQTVWLSFLLRQNVMGAHPYVGLTARGGDNSWFTSPANIQAGYFGASSNDVSGKPMWSLQYAGHTVQTNVPVVTGETVLFVIEDTFGSPDEINLYVDPKTLGRSAPWKPTLQYKPTGSTAFQSITYYGGDTAGQSSLANLCVGTSYAAVTPVPPVPSISAGLTEALLAKIGAVLLVIVGGVLAFRIGRIHDRLLRMH
jgi:hypothetical protein